MKKIKDLLNEKNTIFILLIIGATLIALPMLFDIKNSPESEEYSASSEIYEYTNMLETSLQNAISQLVGSDNVKVVITLESTFENIYVSDASINEAITADKTDKRSEKQLVLTGATGQTQTPVIVKRIPPKVKGAVIVCDGGNDKTLRSCIVAMAATALNISETRIYVTGGY